jgi:HSP20 family protein
MAHGLTLYRPFSMEKTLDDFNRYVDGFFHDPFEAGAQSWLPAVDLKETGDGYQLEAELPGFDEKTVQVHVEGNILTISSKRDEENARDVSPDKKDKKAGHYLLKERQSVFFSRSFQLPENADVNSINASFKNGLLCLDITTTPETQKRQIQISINK